MGFPVLDSVSRLVNKAAKLLPVLALRLALLLLMAIAGIYATIENHTNVPAPSVVASSQSTSPENTISLGTETGTDSLKLIGTFFDGVDLVANRLPGLHRLVVELILIAFALFGAYSLFGRHPH